MLFGTSMITSGCASKLLEAQLALPAYEQVLKASHTFNLLDARRAISVTERQRYILRVRTLARAVAQAYYASREALGFPLLHDAGARQPARRMNDRAPRFPVRDRHRGTAAAGAADAASRRSSARHCRRARQGASSAHGELTGFATPRRLAVRVQRLANAPARAASEAPGTAGQCRLRRRRQAHARGARLRRELRRRGRAALDASCRKARASSSSSPAPAPGARAVDLLPGIVQARARCAADSAAHALGRGQRAVRAPGALAGDALRPGRGAGDAPRHAPPGTRPTAIASMRPRRCASRARAPTSARCASAAGCSRISRRAASASARRSPRSPRSLNGRALIERGAARGSHRAGRVAGGPRRALRGALPRAAARGADLDPAGPPALLSARGCARRSCCPPSSPSATSRAAILPRCARATSAWCVRAWRTRPSSGSRTARQPLAARLAGARRA